MRIELTNAARADLAQAHRYYNEQRDGLGNEFAFEIKQAIARIEQFPEAWPSLSARTRRSHAKRFPYGVVYQIRQDMILIVAVMHLHRHPDAWKSRLDAEDV